MWVNIELGLNPRIVFGHFCNNTQKMVQIVTPDGDGSLFLADGFGNVELRSQNKN